MYYAYKERIHMWFVGLSLDYSMSYVYEISNMRDT